MRCSSMRARFRPRGVRRVGHFVLGFFSGVIATVVGGALYAAFALGEAFPKGPER